MNKITFQEDGHLYFNEHGVEVSSVSSILEYFGISNWDIVDARILEAAQEFGKNVHETTRLSDEDDLESCDPLVNLYLEGWKKFRQDNAISNFDIIEVPLYSKVWGFAGTPDRVCGSMLPDIKTGTKTVAHKIQTAFYQILVEENYKIKIKKRLSVYLKEGKYNHDPHKDKSDLSIAKSLISIYNFKKRENLL